MAIKIDNTTQRECVTTVIIDTEEQKDHGNASIRYYTQMDYVKIVILIIIIKIKNKNLLSKLISHDQK